MIKIHCNQLSDFIRIYLLDWPVLAILLIPFFFCLFFPVYWFYLLPASKYTYLANNWHTNRKVKFLSKKFNFDKNFTIFFGKSKLSTTKKCKSPTFSRVFHPKFFLVKSKLSTAKKSKTAPFSRVFTQNNSTIFLVKSQLNFWTKNEDFEQCVL